MGSKGITAADRITEHAIELATEFVAEKLDESCYPHNLVESPIERIFYAALAAEIKFGQHQIESLSTADRRMLPHDPNTVFVGFQEKLIDWRVDFVLYVRDPFKQREKIIAIECDGHEFHERTKEQAARDRSRDRALNSAGITIFRFTGSELWNKPVECATQVIECCESSLIEFIDDHFGVRRPKDR